MNAPKKLVDLGQAVWLDDLNRGLMHSGTLQRLIEEDGLCGVTSNPAIFEKAIAGSSDYDDDISDLAHRGLSPEEIYDRLSIADVQQAADLFRPLYESSSGQHGFVSLELNPHLAHRTEESVVEARRLWKELDRPNVFVKVPATREGLPAIERLTAEGINVNVTLLFGLPRYRRVADAYLTGIEQRYSSSEPVEQVRSVASFFLSRIDVLIDPILEQKAQLGGPAGRLAGELRGSVAIACARLAYQIYKDLTGTPRWEKIAQWGASPQRLLWASTSAKDPGVSDVKYVETLIGPETINTMPLKTLAAFRDHGQAALTLEEDLDQMSRVLDGLGELNVDLDELTQQLEDEGVEKFIRPYDSLLNTIAERAGVVA